MFDGGSGSGGGSVYECLMVVVVVGWVDTSRPARPVGSLVV